MIQAEVLAKAAELEVVEVARAVRVRLLEQHLNARERDVAVDALALHLQQASSGTFVRCSVVSGAL